MPAQAAGDMSQDRMAVVQLDGERCAGKDLTNAAKDLQGSFLDIRRATGF
jgi:hypothetical protein